jgi:hypothetical protein
MVFSAKRIVILSIEILGDRAERAPAHRLRRSPGQRRIDDRLPNSPSRTNPRRRLAALE